MVRAVTPIPFVKARFFDRCGKPLVGGKVYTYEANTTTYKTTYKDPYGLTPNTNPIILDAAGEADIYLDGTYRIRITDRNDVLVNDVEKIGSWFSDNLQDTLDNISVAMDDALKPVLQNLEEVINTAAAAGAGANGWDDLLVTTQYNRTQRDKNSDIINLKDHGGAVDGTTDDTTAIANARNEASGKKPLLFNGKAKANGYWENLAPLIAEYLGGTPTNYLTNAVATKPLTAHKFFNATPQTGAGFAGYAHRTDIYTKADIDVASTVGFASVVNALSTNSAGASTTNNTNQVAILASAAAQSATASAPVTAINAIATSKYSGQTWQPVVGIEVDVSVTNPPGTFGQNGKSTGIGVSAILSESSVEDGAIAYAADTSKAGKGWRHGVQISGVVNTGVTIARNTVTPQTGVWVSAATTYGVYVGAKQLHDLGAGKNPSYDAEHNPQIGIALGQTGATSSRSNYLRFTATNSSGAEQNIDLYHTGYTLAMRFNGNDAVLFTPNNIYIANNPVVGTRKTGFTEMIGEKDTSTTLDTATVTIQQLAKRVAALQLALTAHGLIGA